MIDVGRDDGATACDFVTHKFGGYFLGNGSTERLTRVLESQIIDITTAELLLAHLGNAHVLADGDVLHLRSNDALARVMQLGHIGPCLCAAWTTHMLKAQMGCLYISLALTAKFRADAGQLLSIATLFDPCFTDSRQTGAQVDLNIRVRVDTRGVINTHRHVGFKAFFGLGICQHDFTHGHTQVGSAAGYIHFMRSAERISGSVVQFGNPVEKVFGLGTHWSILLSGLIGPAV